MSHSKQLLKNATDRTWHSLLKRVMKVLKRADQCLCSLMPVAAVADFVASKLHPLSLLLSMSQISSAQAQMFMQ